MEKQLQRTSPNYATDNGQTSSSIYRFTDKTWNKNNKSRAQM